MQIPHASLDVVVPENMLYGKKITSIQDHDRSRGMSKENMSTTWLIYPSFLLVADNETMDISAVKSRTKVRKE